MKNVGKNVFRILSGDAAWQNLQVARLQGNVQNIAQTLMMAAGVSTLVFGVYGVMNQTISLGALVATMMLGVAGFITFTSFV